MKFFNRKRSGSGEIAGETSPTAASGPVGFGYKIGWLALRTEDAGVAAAALALTDVRDVSWAEGIEAAYAWEGRKTHVFLTPAIDGWTLAVLGGSSLFEDAGVGDGILDLAALSRRFGEAQKFATHRIVEYQEWQRWVDGSPARRYCWIGESGEIRFDEGEPSSAEPDDLLRAADADGDWDGFGLADEETVMEVAAEWSVDPTGLSERTDLAPQGLLGSLL